MRADITRSADETAMLPKNQHTGLRTCIYIWKTISEKRSQVVKEDVKKAGGHAMILP
jgi:hypothetical protein